MNLLSVEAISKQFGETPLFANATFGVAAGERIGVIGVNGSGKSTLLKIVAGLETPDTGRVVTRNSAQITYLPQNPTMDPEQTVLDYIFAGDDPRVVLVRAYEEVSEQLQNDPANAELQARFHELAEQIELAGAWDVERDARDILTRLGIVDTSQRLGVLSGGQRRRVAMAAALMTPADLLILDEPTNHIDADTVAWLETLLRRLPCAVLLVTHDRYFLDRLVNRIVEVERGNVYEYEGGYARYLQTKAEQAEAAQASATRYVSIMRKELAWLARGARARSTKQKARIERIADMQEQGPAAGEAGLSFTIRSPQRLGKRVFELERLDKSFGARTVLRRFSKDIGRGDRIGIVGPNGSGKTTLLNLLAGRLTPDTGTIRRGDTVRLAYYDQESSDLDERLRVIEYLADAASLIQTEDGAIVTAQTMLERFLFPPSAQYAHIASLSGGERRRLQLLRALLFGPNVLLLDEPTNDLDIQTLGVLEDYLDGYEGTLIVASHDRYFLDRTVEQILGFEGDGIVNEYAGGYTAYAEERAQRLAAAAQRQRADKPRVTAPQSASKRPRTLSFKEKRELDEVEQRIAALETEQKDLEALLTSGSGDYAGVQRASERLAAIGAEIEAAFERWAELSAIAEGVA